MRSLQSDKKKLLSMWKRHLHALHNAFEDLEGHTEVALWNAMRQVPSMTYREFEEGVRGIGDDLARREIPVDVVMTSVDATQASALQFLIDRNPAHAAALIRIGSIARSIVLSAFARHWETRVATVEGALKDAEQRLLGTSSYVTGVYERERRRLSHDLHDEIGHELVVLKLRLELIAADVKQNKLSLLTPRLNDALELVGRAVDSVRRLVMDLGPAVFDDLGFLPAIRLYTRQFTASTGIDVNIRDNDIPSDLPLSHQTALYRVLQGALSNVLRHAKAKHVTVAFACLKKTMLVMTIEDDGIGFDVTGAKARQRFGLTAIRERIAVLGGKVHIQSWPASPMGGRRGTRIEVDLPLTEAGVS